MSEIYSIICASIAANNDMRKGVDVKEQTEELIILLNHDYYIPDGSTS